MSAKDCQTLSQVRAHIDQLDAQIVPLLVERTTFVTRAGELKPNKALVIDPERINIIIAKVQEQTRALGGNPVVVGDIYRKMIECFIAFENGEWDRSHG